MPMLVLVTSGCYGMKISVRVPHAARFNRMGCFIAIGRLAAKANMSFDLTWLRH